MFSHPEGAGGCFGEQPVVVESQGNGRLGSDPVRRAAEIFEAHGVFIRSIIRFQTRNRFEQEDFFQEFFLTLIRKPVPAGVQDLKRYLYRAVVNHIVDSMRTRESYHRAIKKYAQQTRISINSRPPATALKKEDTEDRNVTIASFLRHLQEREAQAFVLRYRDNYSIGEIAESMGVNARTVSRYLSTSVRKLRETLAT
jgi:RNA polymerase sigma factor (sigma-70 family)